MMAAESTTSVRATGKSWYLLVSHSVRPAIETTCDPAAIGDRAPATSNEVQRQKLMRDRATVPANARA